MDFLSGDRISNQSPIAKSSSACQHQEEFLFFFSCNYSFPFSHKNTLLSPCNQDTIWVSARICAPWVAVLWSHLFPLISAFSLQVNIKFILWFALCKIPSLSAPRNNKGNLVQTWKKIYNWILLLHIHFNRYYLTQVSFLIWKRFTWLVTLPLKGIRTCHPKISYYGIKIILGWRHLRFNRCRNLLGASLI